MLELRKEEVGHDPADASRTTPDVTAFAGKVPPSRVEHLRGEIDHGNLRDVVAGTTDTGAEGAKADGGRLGNDGIRDWSEGTGERNLGI